MPTDRQTNRKKKKQTKHNLLGKDKYTVRIYIHVP